MGPLTVPEARRQKSRCQQGWAPTESSGEGPSSLFQLLGLQVFLSLWAPPTSDPVFTWLVSVCSPVRTL